MTSMAARRSCWHVLSRSFEHFAPFVAGAGRMNYGRFLLYNVTGGILWVALGVVAGYFFGSVPIIKNNFSLFILGVVALSFVPVLISLLRGMGKRKPDARAAAR